MTYRNQVQRLHEMGYAFTVLWDRSERLEEVAATLRAGRKETGILWTRGEFRNDTLRRILKALDELHVPYEYLEGVL